MPCTRTCAARRRRRSGGARSAALRRLHAGEGTAASDVVARARSKTRRQSAAGRIRRRARRSAALWPAISHSLPDPGADIGKAARTASETGVPLCACRRTGNCRRHRHRSSRRASPDSICRTRVRRVRLGARDRRRIGIVAHRLLRQLARGRDRALERSNESRASASESRASLRRLD